MFNKILNNDTNLREILSIYLFLEQLFYFICVKMQTNSNFITLFTTNTWIAQIFIPAVFI